MIAHANHMKARGTRAVAESRECLLTGAERNVTARELDASCSGHGACVFHQCVCEEGYHGWQCARKESPRSHNLTLTMLAQMRGEYERAEYELSVGHEVSVATANRTLLLLLYATHPERIAKLIGMYGCLEKLVGTRVRLAFLVKPTTSTASQQRSMLGACRCLCRLDILGRSCGCVSTELRPGAWPTAVADAIHELAGSEDAMEVDLLYAHADLYLSPRFIAAIDRRALWSSEARDLLTFHRRDGILENLKQLSQRQVHGTNWWHDSARHCGRSAARLGLTHCAHQWADAYYVPGTALRIFARLSDHFRSTFMETSSPTILRTLHILGGVPWASPPVRCAGSCCTKVPWHVALTAPCAHRVALQDPSVRFECGAVYRPPDAPPLAPSRWAVDNAFGGGLQANATVRSSSWGQAANREDWATRVCVSGSMSGLSGGE